MSGGSVRAALYLVFYASSIEPLLIVLRKSLVGLKVSAEHEVKSSAYADDICVLVIDSKDIGLVEENLELLNKVMTAVINRGKSQALWMGQASGSLPSLPLQLRWSFEGI